MCQQGAAVTQNAKAKATTYHSCPERSQVGLPQGDEGLCYFSQTAPWPWCWSSGLLTSLLPVPIWRCCKVWV